jgi:hypothetical protein
MKRALSVWFAIALCVLASPASTQETARELKLSDDLSVNVPPGWQLQNQTRDSIAIHVPLQKERKTTVGGDDKDVKPNFVVASEAGMLITREQRRDHAEAVRRLAEIASEYPERASPLLIAGWPAIERRYRAVMPQPGEAESPSDIVQTSFATTAIAAGTTVVRFNTMLAPDADPKLLDQALAIGRGLRAPQGPADVSKRELGEIQKMTKPPRGPSAPPRQQPKAGRTGAPAAPSRKEAGVAIQVQTGVGELEVASNDGQHVVVAANSGFSFSDNFGATWTFGGGTPCNQTRCDGDPSLAVGKSGAIYYAWIGGTASGLSDGVSRSTDNGHTYTFRGLAATCPGATSCSVADQEHIAADRNNAAAGGDDRVYNVWRNFAPTFSINISCSTDGASTWTGGVAIGAGDFPRVSVGGDGFVYVAWASGGNMQLHKFSNCDAGLAPQVGWPVTVSAFTNVVCPEPGLDRCNGRNILSSPKVAVDDLDPNHIYYAFATSTGAGNEDVMVFDSSNGGASFPRSVRVNSAVTAHRFMPWVSSYGGMAVVSWYDRRNATAANNDLTRYFTGGAAVRGLNLVALAETDLSGASDNQCSTWPAATNAPSDSESCSVQPQLAGRCFSSLGPPPVGSGAPCDFSTPMCAAGEMCFAGRGAPKYGDYNGNAAGAGLTYSAWSSSVPPASVGGAGGTIRVYASADRIPSDFYVRDWNANPNFDNGAQPSTNPVFWATSDVWNQSTSTPAAPGADGSVAGDPPSRAGSNFAYARVSRRAPAASTAPAATVTVNFFFGDYGLGAGFVPIGSEIVTFAPGDLAQITPAHAWTVPVGASSHLCLAVQIDGPDGDTFALPSIAGTAPGPADPLIIADNNKAQRNLQDTIGTTAGTELIAMISNAQRQRRPMRLRVSMPKDVQIDGTFEVIGGKQKVKATNDARIEIGNLAPREIRWLRFRATGLAAAKTPTAVHVFEDTDPPANGFTIRLHAEPIETVARRNLIELAGVLARVAQYEKSPLANKEAELALKASYEASETVYAAFLSENRPAIAEIIAQHLRRMKEGDRFGIGEAATDLANALEQKNIDAAAAANISLVERLDAQLTAAMRQGGKKGADRFSTSR